MSSETEALRRVDSPLPGTEPAATAPAGWLDTVVARLAEPTLGAGFGRWSHGRLTVRWADGRTGTYGQPGAEPHVTLRVHHPALYRKFLLRGDLGAGEAFMDGDWSADDLPRFIELVLRNPQCFALDSVLSRAANVGNDLLHRARANTRTGSRRNIRAHYDLSNAFFALFLDESMTYSSAVFDGADDTLAAAQQRKLRRLADAAGVRPGDRVLEIGCGWGAFALLLAREYGAHVTAITVSDEQHAMARARIAAAGLEHRVHVRVCDYRDVGGRYDRIVSVEMLEAVGREFWPSFFETCHRVLAPGGRVALQTIAIASHRFDQYARHCDWIQKYIFPGGLLPSLLELTKAAARATPLTVHALDDIGLHYARTLAAWRVRFLSRLDEVRRLGFDDRFIRMWDYYLSSCEAAFATRSLGTYQLVLARDGEDLR
jgi:cyclopropane-fatty-acyl-phospholipid synthase